jgi:transposase
MVLKQGHGAAAQGGNAETWRELIKKVWEVDPLTCPQCGSEMKIISLIQDPDVIRQILKHLGL